MTTIVKGNKKTAFDKERLFQFIERVTGRTDESFNKKVARSIEANDEYSAKSVTQLLINTKLGDVDEVEKFGIDDASKIYLEQLYSEASKNRGYNRSEKYGDFYELIKMLTYKGLYSTHILEKYSREEIVGLSKLINPENDNLFDYSGLYLMVDRYITSGYEEEIYELPQERWMIISMFLMQNEDKQHRSLLVAEAYWALSNMHMTVATPTLSNAGKPHGQLSSCFIDTIGDSLQGIYNSNTDVANLSKFGGGIGVYMGKVRSKNASIRGFANASSGVVPWIKQLNNTAVSVDQLGQRAGAVAIYLDVFHKDIFAFLDLKLNNGDERMRAHDIFTGVSVPDLFMEQVEKREKWFLFDPHEVKEVMGWKDENGKPLGLEDFYDEERGSGSWRKKYFECVNNPMLSKVEVDAIEVMKRVLRSQLETGTPFMFYRDTVNRMNPNKHKGMIYSSNLCSEIAQNMSETVQYEEVVDGDRIITYKESGDFVVCNLSSLNLGRAVPEDVLERLIPIQVRMLDNVIEINKLPVSQATVTNHKYRSIGLGTFGWHHLLALKNIEWESEEAVEYADKLYEKIAYLTIKASMELSKEKGSYELFEGSDWHTGEYFEIRDYIRGGKNNSELDWVELANLVKDNGIRNAYLMAIAPNSSTSRICNSTASIDPIFKPFYHEEKKNFKLPVVAPDLDHNTYNVYRRSAYILDQRWSVKQNSARQRHIDQAISFNIYVPNTIKASVLLDLHLQAWNTGMKTTYYTRSTATDIDDCEWCHS